MASNDSLQSAQELMDNYWQRVPIESNDGFSIDVQADALARIAEQLTITNYLLTALVERLG